MTTAILAASWHWNPPILREGPRQLHSSPWTVRGAGKEEKRKIAGWSTKMLEATANMRVETLRKWCSGEASAKKVLTTGYGRSCAARCRRKLWRRTSLMRQTKVLIKDAVSGSIGGSSRRKRGIALGSSEKSVGQEFFSRFSVKYRWVCRQEERKKRKSSSCKGWESWQE